MSSLQQRRSQRRGLIQSRVLWRLLKNIFSLVWLFLMIWLYSKFTVTEMLPLQINVRRNSKKKKVCSVLNEVKLSIHYQYNINYFSLSIKKKLSQSPIIRVPLGSFNNQLRIPRNRAAAAAAAVLIFHGDFVKQVNSLTGVPSRSTLQLPGRFPWGSLSCLQGLLCHCKLTDLLAAETSESAGRPSALHLRGDSARCHWDRKAALTKG